MECFIVEQRDVSEERRELLLRDEEAHHAVHVLRLRQGEMLLVTNLIGTCYECTFQVADGGKKESLSVRCQIQNVLPDFGEPSNDVHLIQGMISQPARWEFLLEKATELGVRVICPVETQRTEHRSLKLDRSERILRAAVKQTKRANKPWLRLPKSSSNDGHSGELSSLREALSQAQEDKRTIYILHESAEIESSLQRLIAQQPSKRLALAVGPEGGFEEEEIQMAVREFGAVVASLGKRRLRAETAALAALAIAIED